MMSRLLFITYFIVQIISIKGGHSWATFKILETKFMIKMISKSPNYFYLAFLQIMMHKINVFWMQSSNTYWLLKDLTSLSQNLLQLCVCVRVCVCVCVCVCLCVCLYPSTCWLLPTARRLWRTWDVRSNDLLLWVFLGASAKLFQLNFRIYHISPPKT